MNVLPLADVTDFAYHTVASGFVVALAVICALQYLLHLHIRGRATRDAERSRHEMGGMECALTRLRKDRSVMRYENQILREFVSQTECDKAVGLLLRRFVSNPENGLAAFFRMDDGLPQLSQHRGLSATGCDRIEIDEPIVHRLRQGQSVVLEGSDLRETLLWSRLGPKDKTKTHQMALFPVGEPKELLGILVTSELFPSDADLAEQVELAERLLESISCSLKHKLTMEQQQSELRWTQEMLNLRGITEKRFTSPILMIEEFLKQLANKVGAERGTMFLSMQDEIGSLKPLVRTPDEELTPGLREAWSRHEETLGMNGVSLEQVAQYGPDQLQRLGIDSLVGRAMLVPLIQSRGSIGIIVLTKGGSDCFGKLEQSVATWAAEFLAQTMLRVLSQAAVERQARLDGLTQLANRRTFDTQLAQEVRVARATETPCSLLLLDLDRFKSVNDTHGHQGGDKALQTVSQVLRDQLAKMRSGDRALAARYGGEEIAVILPGIGMEGATRIAESIRAAVEARPVEHDGTVFYITTSVGVSTTPQHAQNQEELIAAADVALYQAKAMGRNRVCFPEASLVM